MDSENLNKQIEEIEALQSIYGDDFIQASNLSGPHTIKIVENKNEVLLQITISPKYPSNAPPKCEISAPWMDRKIKENLHTKIEGIYVENIGEPIIFQCVEAVREILLSIKPLAPKNNDHKKKSPVVEPENVLQSNVTCPEITHAEVITDRKSIFQGHAAEVHNVEEVKAVLAKLRENKKIANATHNMYAYRIDKKTPKGDTILQDCEDDGENHAGGRMLHLLQILDQRNTLVVVSRWYGGIQLGPDRFRHINNATRQAIKQAGLLKQ